MPILSSTLKALAYAETTKPAWAAKVRDLLGADLRLRGFRNGTEFLSVGCIGPITVSEEGDITAFGQLSGTTVRQAADLSSGTCTLRLEGNGHTITFTLGLTGSGAEFTLPSSPTGAADLGFAFAAGAGMRSPLTLNLPDQPNDPNVPSIAPSTPTIIELVDWRDPANPIVVGTANFSPATRQDDWVFQHPELHEEIGAVALYEVDDTIKWTSGLPTTMHFELGGMLLISAARNTESGTRQLEQMVLAFKPYNRWASYPAMDTFVRAHWPVLQDGWPPVFGACDNADKADRTVLPPFKINLKTADGTIVHTHEWKAFNDKPTVPINSPLLSEVQTATEPSMPRFNCGMMLPWQNERTRMSSKAGKYYPGVEAYAYGDDSSKGGTSSNGYNPLLAYKYGQANSVNQWWAMPAYPLKDTQDRDNAYLTAYESRPKDPALFINRDHYPWYRGCGYMYQAGSVSGHDWLTGKGGVRFDRSVVPSVLAIWAADPNFVRPEGNVPIRDLLDQWGLAYFNHSHHWLRDVKSFTGVPKDQIFRGDWVYASAYYGGGPYGKLGESRGPDKTVDMCGIGNGKDRWINNNDPEGFLYWSGWLRDSLHSYAYAAWWAVMTNSPMHALIASHDYNAQWMSSLGSSYPTTNPLGSGDIGTSGYWGTRDHAWRWLAYVMQWMVATENPRGLSREDVASRFQIELELAYDRVYKPVFLDNSQKPIHVSLRNLGHNCVVDGGGKNLGSGHGSLGLYMVHVLVTMRQFGLFAAMRARSDKCKKALDMMITLLDKQVIDYVLDTDMRDSYYPFIATGTTGTNIPANWGEQKAMLAAAYPVMPAGANPDNYVGWQQWIDFVRTYDGRASEQTGCCHLYMQYLKARKHFFPDYAAPRLDAAITKLQGYYDLHTSMVAQGKSYNWGTLHPSHGPIKAPTELAPV